MTASPALALDLDANGVRSRAEVTQFLRAVAPLEALERRRLRGALLAMSAWYRLMPLAPHSATIEEASWLA